MKPELFTRKFIVGVILIILNFVIGKIATFIFLIYYYDLTIRWISIITYIVSWLMLFLGLYLCGTEGYKYSKKLYKRYTSYKTYKHHLKRSLKHGRKVIKRGRRAIKMMSKKIVVNRR